MKQIDINGYREEIIERSDFPIEKCKESVAGKHMHYKILKNKILKRIVRALCFGSFVIFVLEFVIFVLEN